ncbi:hypothetical protein TNCV_2613871 [Trichonephila clavipes]|nr:hypothetical protein TNCV_2613871 [Trichonephila clavipes]
MVQTLIRTDSKLYPTSNKSHETEGYKKDFSDRSELFQSTASIESDLSQRAARTDVAEKDRFSERRTKHNVSE